jgi:glycosyltransferase involved in cell wall biosynthesis
MRDQVTLLRAFDDLKKTLCEAHLLMIGDGPERAVLESKVQQLGLAESVSFTGYSDEIGDYLKASDIYVNPTLDEGFGIAVVEAMLSGTPVVLSDCGAHPELIVPDRSGLLYERGNASNLASQLRFLIDKPSVRRSIAEAGKIQAQQRFSPAVYATQYLRVVKAKATISQAAG